MLNHAFTLFKKEWFALKNLVKNKDPVIQKADKSSTVVNLNEKITFLKSKLS